MENDSGGVKLFHWGQGERQKRTEESQLEFNSEIASSFFKLVFWISKPKQYRRSEGGAGSSSSSLSMSFSFCFLTTYQWFLEHQKSTCQPFPAFPPEISAVTNQHVLSMRHFVKTPPKGFGPIYLYCAVVTRLSPTLWVNARTLLKNFRKHLLHLLLETS